MELTEDIDSINRQLIDLFGIDTETGHAMYRVVWSMDQFEKRLMHTTDEGLDLLFPEVRVVPKYRQWIKERYVLEQLVLVPEVSQGDIPVSKKSYEPLFVFENGYTNEYLPPKLEAAKFVIDTVRAAQGKKSMAKYIDAEAQNPIEEKEKRIHKLHEELFGDESGLLGRTITGEAIVVPQEYKGSKES